MGREDTCGKGANNTRIVHSRMVGAMWRAASLVWGEREESFQSWAHSHREENCWRQREEHVWRSGDVEFSGAGEGVRVWAGEALKVLYFSLRTTGSPSEAHCSGTTQIVLMKEVEGSRQEGMGPVNSYFNSPCRMWLCERGFQRHWGAEPRGFDGLNIVLRERMGSRLLSSVLAWAVGKMTVSFIEEHCSAF